MKNSQRKSQDDQQKNPMTVINLGWPPKETHPNARPHWAVKAKAAKAYRAQSYLATKSQVKGLYTEDGAIDLHVVFYPKTNRKRDLDNLIAAIKPGLDGIADALQINDNRFQYLVAKLEQADNPARVEIRLEPAEYETDA